MVSSLDDPEQEALSDSFLQPDPIVGTSPGIAEVQLRIHQVATTHTTVLLRGEAGTGKELVASAIHAGSLIADKPLVKVHCAALSEELLESELFGYAEGAFPGALSGRVGRIEEADGGTLFLDEIGHFSPAVQVKLLRLLQEGEFEPAGGNRPRTACVRVLAATARDLEAAVESGQFRQDLYYQMSVFPICLPPLRERRDDIPLLAEHFVRKYSEKMGKPVQQIDAAAISMLLAYDWPGNVRQLENCIEYAVLLSRDGVIHSHNLPPALQVPEAQAAAALGPLKARVAILERDLIAAALRSCGGNVRAAAEQLGITPRIARYKMKKLGIDIRQFPEQSGD
jgi:Nif-specific regulatory protein